MKLYKIFNTTMGTYLQLVKKLHETKEDAVIIYTLKPTMLIGKNTDYKRYKENDEVPVFRLPGPVDGFYCDNNVPTFVVLFKTNNPDSFSIRNKLNNVLNNLGIDSKTNKTNDIVHKNKKIAGSVRKISVEGDYLWTGIGLSMNVDYDTAEKVFSFEKHDGIRERSAGLWQLGETISKEEIIEGFEKEMEKYFNTKLELQPEPEEANIKQNDTFLKEGRYSK